MINSLRPLASGRPSQYALESLHRALVSAGAREVTLAPVAAKLLGRVPLPLPGRHRRPLTVVGVMGLRRHHYVAAASSRPVAAYCFDVWEPDLEEWVGLLRRFPPRLVITTSSDACAALSEELDLPVAHLPEAVDPELFSPAVPLEQRSISVLEMGRRDDAFHEAVAGHPALTGRAHLYQQDASTLVFPDAETMRAGLADTVVSVCFPSSLTHPARSGSFETVTARYFESMAAGALVLGTAPPELIELFGYNPVVEVDRAAPAEQLADLLAGARTWQDLVDRNLSRLHEVGTWQVRAAQILRLVERYAR